MSTVEEPGYRERCLEEKGRHCHRCFGLQDPGSPNIIAHHIDGDRTNNRLENLSPLCGSCHQICHKNDHWGDFDEFLLSFPDPRVVGDNYKFGPDENVALLTESEREIISGERTVNDNCRHMVESLVRSRVEQELERDVEVLREHFPEVYETVEEVVCDG